MHPKVPPGNLTTIQNTIQGDLKAMSEADRRADFKKLKVGAVLALMGANQDALAGWDGEGDYPTTGMSDAEVNTFNQWTKSAFFNDGESTLEELLLGGIATEEPPTADEQDQTGEPG